MENIASAAQTRRSQARASWKPAPTAWPWTAAMLIRSGRRQALNASWKVEICSAIARSSSSTSSANDVSPGMPSGVNIRVSSPALNDLPSARITATRTSAIQRLRDLGEDLPHPGRLSVAALGPAQGDRRDRSVLLHAQAGLEPLVRCFRHAGTLEPSTHHPRPHLHTLAARAPSSVQVPRCWVDRSDGFEALRVSVPVVIRLFAQMAGAGIPLATTDRRHLDGVGTAALGCPEHMFEVRQDLDARMDADATLAYAVACRCRAA